MLPVAKGQKLHGRPTRHAERLSPICYFGRRRLDFMLPFQDGKLSASSRFRAPRWNATALNRLTVCLHETAAGLGPWHPDKTQSMYHLPFIAKHERTNRRLVARVTIHMHSAFFLSSQQQEASYCYYYSALEGKDWERRVSYVNIHDR